MLMPVFIAGTKATVTRTATATYASTPTPSITFSSLALGVAGKRHIALAVGYLFSGTITGVTIAGVTATLLASTVVIGGVRSAIYIASVPTGTTGDVVVTFSGNSPSLFVGVYALYNLRSATPTDTATASVDGGASTYTLSLNSDISGGGVAVATFTGSNGVSSAVPIGLSNNVAVYAVGSSVCYAADYSATSTEAPRTMGWTVNQDTAGCLATFR